MDMLETSLAVWDLANLIKPIDIVTLELLVILLSIVPNFFVESLSTDWPSDQLCSADALGLTEASHALLRLPSRRGDGDAQPLLHALWLVHDGNHVVLLVEFQALSWWPA
ncbi:uncharacterized protein LOC124690888 [Lolium rigidum]|uniref:uncharacterized protein LOC124690888 n=1 Tax=Lolium rigidum TaxID=89674 RepID=UPI001F5E1F24|nr:uncharacterized protein LOC124690888 [Lolium rigidum]